MIFFCTKQDCSQQTCGVKITLFPLLVNIIPLIYMNQTREMGKKKLSFIPFWLSREIIYKLRYFKP